MHESLISRLRRSVAQFRNRPGRERGQVVALFALFLVVFLGFAALTIDYGSWLKVRRDYQNVVDSAVLAGSGFLGRPIDATKRTQARRAAWESINTQLGLGLNGGQLSALEGSNTPAASPSVFGDFRIWVSTPPIGSGARYLGGFTGANDRYLFAYIERDNASYFSRIFGQGDRTISAWATAGTFSNRYAVITLRQNGQAGPANATDINLSGTNTILEVVDGDVGGNWGMKLNSSTQLWLHGSSGIDGADAYLVDYVSCGNSCWSPDQVNVGPPTYIPDKEVLALPSIIDDPNYPLPSVISTLPSTGGNPPAVPKAIGTENGPPASSIGSVTITKGALTANGVGCTPASPRIGPGWYHDININSGNCVVLDPTHNFSDPNDNDGDGDFGQTDVPQQQQPGIFYITGAFNVNNGALAVGDGVTLVFKPGSNSDGLIVNGDGAVDLNTGATDGVKGFPPNMKKAAYMTDGSYSYSWNAGLAQWVYTADNNDVSKVGISIYVAKPSQYGIGAVDANTDVIKVNAGAALSWNGLMYAPHDNVVLSGQPTHDAIGQFVSWTFKLDGGTTVRQTYDGPDSALPRLVEPHLGQ
jgi:hypothetical protein